MTKTHATLDLDSDLLRDAARALGTTRTTDTVHAALRAVVAPRQLDGCRSTPSSMSILFTRTSMEGRHE